MKVRIFALLPLAIFISGCAITGGADESEEIPPVVYGEFDPDQIEVLRDLQQLLQLEDRKLEGCLNYEMSGCSASQCQYAQSPFGQMPRFGGLHFPSGRLAIEGRIYGFHWGRPRSPTETETIFPFLPPRQDGLDAEHVNCYFACVESSSKTCKEQAASRATEEGEVDPPPKGPRISETADPVSGKCEGDNPPAGAAHGCPATLTGHPPEP